MGSKADTIRDVYKQVADEIMSDYGNSSVHDKGLVIAHLSVELIEEWELEDSYTRDVWIKRTANALRGK